MSAVVSGRTAGSDRPGARAGVQPHRTGLLPPPRLLRGAPGPPPTPARSTAPRTGCWPSAATRTSVPSAVIRTASCPGAGFWSTIRCGTRRGQGGTPGRSCTSTRPCTPPTAPWSTASSRRGRWPPWPAGSGRWSSACSTPCPPDHRGLRRAGGRPHPHHRHRRDVRRGRRRPCPLPSLVRRGHRECRPHRRGAGGGARPDGHVPDGAHQLADDRVQRPARLLKASSLDDRPLSRAEIMGFCLTLLVAGNETTRTLISGGVEALARHPDQRAMLVGDPSLVPGAVEEILRWVTPIQAFGRTAVVDVEIAGVAVGPGEFVVMLYASANRDEAGLRTHGRPVPRHPTGAAHPSGLRLRRARLPRSQPGPARGQDLLRGAPRPLPGLSSSRVSPTYTRSTLVRGARTMPVVLAP